MYIIKIPNPTLVETRPPFILSIRQRKKRDKYGSSSSPRMETREIDTEVRQKASSMDTSVRVEHK